MMYITHINLCNYIYCACRQITPVYPAKPQGTSCKRKWPPDLIALEFRLEVKHNYIIISSHGFVSSEPSSVFSKINRKCQLIRKRTNVLRNRTPGTTKKVSYDRHTAIEKASQLGSHVSSSHNNSDRSHFFCLVRHFIPTIQAKAFYDSVSQF